MKRVAVKISFLRPYRLREDQDVEKSLEELRQLWRGYLGPDVQQLTLELITVQEVGE